MTTDVQSATHLPRSAPARAVGITIGAAMIRQMSPSRAIARRTPPARSVTSRPIWRVAAVDRDTGRLKTYPDTIPITTGVTRNSTPPYDSKTEIPEATATPPTARAASTATIP